MRGRVGRDERGEEGGEERMGSKRHNLQAVELSQRLQTDVQIVSKPPAPAKGSDLAFVWAIRPCGPAGWLALPLIKAVDVETNPGPTATHKQVWICYICHKKYMVGSRYR